MKFGYVKTLFGIIASVPLDVYVKVSKKCPNRSVIIAEYNATSIPDCDVVIFTGVNAFLNCATHLHDEMVAIVCGGPLQIDMLPGIVPLDYKKTMSYMFDLIEPDYSVVLSAIKSRKTLPSRVKKLKINHLALILDNTASGGILTTEWNKLLSVINMVGRNKLRGALVSLIQDDASPDILLETGSFIRDAEVKIRLQEVVNKLKTKKAKLLMEALRKSINKEKSTPVATLAKTYDIDLFEIAFFRKMIIQYKTNSHKEFYTTSNP